MPDALPAITRPFRFDVDALTRLLHEAGVSSEGLAECLDDYLVARAGERIVGVVGLASAGETAWLQVLAVAPAARGQGLERALVEAALADAGRRGARRVVARTALDDDLLRALGFEPLTPAALRALNDAGWEAERDPAVAGYVERSLP